MRCWGEELSDWSTGPTWIAGADAQSIALEGEAVVLRDRAGRTWELPKGTRPKGMSDFVPRTSPAAVARACRGDRCCWVDGDAVTCARPRRPEDPAGQGPVRGPVAGVTNPVAVSVGESHACAVTREGIAFCWGSGDSGRLGAGRDARPGEGASEVAGLSDLAEISVGYGTTCARTRKGDVWCWGSDAYGILGATRSERGVPVRILGLPPARSIAVGGFHACSLGADGKVRCWGKGTDGQLGDGMKKDAKKPVEAAGVTRATAIVAATSRTCALRDDESVWCWGTGLAGELGDGRSSEEHAAIPVEGVAGAVRLCVQRDAYPRRTCAIDSARAMWCWGEGSAAKRVATSVLSCDARCTVFADGRLDCGSRQVTGAPPYVATSTSLDGGCGLGADGAVSCWKEEGKAPVTIAQGATSVSVGQDVGCLLKGRGELSCWGEVSRYARSEELVSAGLDDVAEVSLDDAIGIGSGVLRRHDGSVWWFYWAMTSYARKALDLRAKPLEGVAAAVSVAGGAENGCAALADGHVRCWGGRGHGKLGDGLTVGRSRRAVEVAGVDDAVGVAAGDTFHCALRRGAASRAGG